MITYELAKELKDAGFSQKSTEINGCFYYRNKNIINISVMVCKPEKNMIYIPTLEELIEACGDEKFSLWCYPHGYIIGFTPGSMKDDMRICKTPSEAVARLWLVLNENKDA